MKRRPLPRQLLWVAALVLAVIVSLVLAVPPFRPHTQEAQQLPAVAFDPDAWAVESGPERLAYDRPAVDPKIKQAMNHVPIPWTLCRQMPI